MKPMLSSLSALAAVFLIAVPSASALSCSQQAAELQRQQGEAQALADTRLTLVDDVEAAGDAWEDLEIHRLVSSQHATAADDAKAIYEALKADLLEKEATLQTLVISLNDQVTAYNAKCVRN